MAAMPDKIVVKTNDGAEVELAKNVYEQSSYLVEQVGLGSDSVIEMFDVDKDQLTKVANFLSQNAENPIPVGEIEQQDPFAPQGEVKKIPKPLASPNLVDAGFPKWAVKWVDELSQDDLFEYANLSQSLDVHPMGLLLCGKIASIIKGMSLEDYHKTFELEKDFTPEEEEKIRQENSWAES